MMCPAKEQPDLPSLLNWLCALGGALSLLPGCRTGERSDLRDWLYHTPIEISEQAGVQATSFPVSFHLKTAAMAQAGLLQKDASDLRITVSGKDLPFQLTSLSTKTTEVAFQVSLSPGQTRGMW